MQRKNIQWYKVLLKHNEVCVIKCILIAFMQVYHTVTGVTIVLFLYKRGICGTSCTTIEIIHFLFFVLFFCLFVSLVILS